MLSRYGSAMEPDVSRSDASRVSYAPPPGSPVVLVIETTGSVCAAALRDDRGMQAARSPVLERGHAERIVDVCAETLSDAGAGWADLTHVAVCTGPGTFAGLRAGVAAARGLALSLAIPAVGVTAFEALAAAWTKERADPDTRERVDDGAASSVVVAMDLRRGRIGAQRFDAGVAVGEPITTDAEGVLALAAGDRFAPRRAAPPSSPAPIIGSAMMAVGGAAFCKGDGWRAPDTRGVALAALGLISTGDAPPAVPLYLRDADAAPARPPVARAGVSPDRPHPAEGSVA